MIRTATRTMVGLCEVVRIQNYLEGILGRHAYLVLHDAVKSQLRERIFAEEVVGL